MKAVMLTNDWGSMWESNCQNSGEDLIFLAGRLVIGWKVGYWLRNLAGLLDFFFVCFCCGFNFCVRIMCWVCL